MGLVAFCASTFTMGARPIACLDFLRFGSPVPSQDPAASWWGSWAGIGGYGNSFGVPTVCGSVGFGPAL